MATSGGPGARPIRRTMAFEALYHPNLIIRLPYRETLGEDALHLAIQPPPVLGGEVLGGDHHHRDVVPGRARPELGEQLEAIHVRHHEVQHDQSREPADQRRVRGRLLRRRTWGP